MSELKNILKFIINIHFLHLGGCTIAGINYMDPIRQRDLPSEDPCNPLYWYPRALPEKCYIKPDPEPIKPDFPPIPMPIPVPYPQPMPLPMPHMIPPPLIPSPMMAPPVPLPFGVPLPQSVPALPFPPAPFPPPFGGNPYGHDQTGFIPGLPGLVSRDGGINILPFSDVYADVLEKYKQKKIRKRLEKVFGKYGKRKRRYRNWRRRRH